MHIVTYEVPVGVHGFTLSFTPDLGMAGLWDWKVNV